MTLDTTLRETLFAMFVGNEQLADKYAVTMLDSDKPATDEELEEHVRTTFHADPDVIRSLDFNASFNKSRIRIWRSEYNRGLWSTPPICKSFRYGPDGLPINRHQHPLTVEQFAKELIDFKFSDPRKQDAAELMKGFENVSPVTQTR